MANERSNTESKALEVNLDPRRYGTFAEIGAGQEVVRWFFRVGGAAGTIAKSMSAYDMTVSDAIYGQCDRYVCRQRLESMLDHEQELNLNRLRESRGDTTAFFVFADTVSARNFKGTNECHGWMGVRFQAHPRGRKKGTFYFSAFRGRPRGRIVACNPRRLAAIFTQLSAPNGVPRAMLRRIASSSASLCGRFTTLVQFAGRATGEAANNGQSAFGPRAARLDHRQSSARLTKLARSAFRSTYRKTARKCSSR
jgi:hypothetical protein